MEESQVTPPKPQAYICSPCGQKFEGQDCVQQYYDHVCPATGFKPTDPRHLGPEFANISAAAQSRGAQYKINTSIKTETTTQSFPEEIKEAIERRSDQGL